MHILPLGKKGKRQQPHWQLLLIGTVESNLSGTQEMLRRQSVKHEQRAKSNQPSSFSSLGIFMKGKPANLFKKKKKQRSAVGGLTRDGVVVQQSKQARQYEAWCKQFLSPPLIIAESLPESPNQVAVPPILSCQYQIQNPTEAAQWPLRTEASQQLDNCSHSCHGYKQCKQAEPLTAFWFPTCDYASFCKIQSLWSSSFNIPWLLQPVVSHVLSQ